MAAAGLHAVEHPWSPGWVGQSSASPPCATPLPLLPDSCETSNLLPRVVRRVTGVV